MFSHDLPTCISDLICRFAYDASLKETRSSLNICLDLLDDLGSHAIINPTCCDYTRSPTWVYTRETMQTMDRYTFHIWALKTEPCINPLYRFFVWFNMRDLFNYPRIHQLIEDLDWRKIRGRLMFPMSRKRFMRVVGTNLSCLLEFSYLLLRLNSHHLA